MDEPKIGENVRYYRKLKGWTQQELADAAKINIGSVVALEKSRPGTKLATIERVAKALQKHPADLFRRHNPEAVSRAEASAPRVEISEPALQAAVLGAFRQLAAAPGTQRLFAEAQRRADQLHAEVKAEQETDPDRQAPATGTRGPVRTRRGRTRRGQNPV